MFGKLYVGSRISPIVGIDVHAEVIDYCAEVTVKQRYRNAEESPMETLYEFKLPEGASVASCDVEVGSRKLRVEVQEKGRAEDDYDDAVAAGRSAMIMRRKDDDPNFFSLVLGNIGPNEEAFVTLTYVSVAELDNDKIVLSLDGSEYCKVRFAEPPEGTAENDKRVAPGFNLSVHFATQCQLRSVSSPSHPTTVELDEGGLGATVRLASGGDWEKNRFFVVEAVVADPHQPCSRVQKHADGSYMAMVSFYPKLESIDPKSEMIFVLDRSGSMWGRPIECALATLQFFIRSLPENSLFNIVGFGSTYEFFSPSSVAYSNETLKEASNAIKKMDANLGGTNISDPLKSIFSAPVKSGYPRQVFILTDGEVDDPTDCIRIVKQNARTSRVFTFGIGNSVDKGLVRGMAKAGEGQCCIVENNDAIRRAVMSQLEAALQPALTEARVEWNNAESGKPEEHVIQTPANPPPLFRGSRLVSFAALPASCPPCRVSLTGSFGDTQYKSVVNVCPEKDIIPGNQILKMGAHSLIEDIESGAAEGDTVALSLKYGVLCRKTAFLAISSSGSALRASMVSRRVEELCFTDAAPDFDMEECSAPDVGAFSGFSFVSRQSDSDLDDVPIPEVEKSIKSFSPRCYHNMLEDDPVDLDDGCVEEEDGCVCDDDECDACACDDDDEWEYECECKSECDVEKDTEAVPPSEVTIDFVIDQVNADGSFPVSALSMCGLCEKDALSVIPDASGAVCHDADLLQVIWATVILVEMIRKRFATRETEWKLIVSKSEKFIQKNLGSSLFDKWKQAAAQFISTH